MAPQDLELQNKIAEKLNTITVNLLSIESLQENVAELTLDLAQLFKDSGDKKSLGQVKLAVQVYADGLKTQQDEFDKVEKAKGKLEAVKLMREEMSLYDRFRPTDLHEQAEALLDS